MVETKMAETKCKQTENTKDSLDNFLNLNFIYIREFKNSTSRLKQFSSELFSQPPRY